MSLREPKFHSHGTAATNIRILVVNFTSTSLHVAETISKRTWFSFNYGHPHHAPWTNGQAVELIIVVSSRFCVSLMCHLCWNKDGSFAGTPNQRQGYEPWNHTYHINNTSNVRPPPYSSSSDIVATANPKPQTLINPLAPNQSSSPAILSWKTIVSNSWTIHS